MFAEHPRDNDDELGYYAAPTFKVLYTSTSTAVETAGTAAAAAAIGSHASDAHAAVVDDTVDDDEVIAAITRSFCNGAGEMVLRINRIS